jgi:antitoxin FitA
LFHRAAEILVLTHTLKPTHITQDIRRVLKLRFKTKSKADFSAPCKGSARKLPSLDPKRGLAGACAIIDCNDIIAIMASITIRKLEQTTKRKLKIRAAMHGWSMEQEAREILKNALRPARQRPVNLAEAIRRRFAPLGGVELEPLPREPVRDPGIE